MLSWLDQHLKKQGYYFKDKVNTPLIAKDIRQKLIDAGLDIADFLMDGIV